MKEDIIKAIQGGNAEAVKQLLVLHPDLINARTPTGISIILLAAYYRNHEIMEILLAEQPSLDVYEAAATGNYDRVYDIITYDPEAVNSYAPDGFTPLGLASYFGHYDLVKLLISKGANVNTASRNSYKVAPIHSAVSSGDLEIAKLLLENKANSNMPQMLGVTPLHSAAHTGNTEMVRLLLHHQADLNAKMNSGQTPLDMALEKNHLPAAELLKTRIG